MNLVYITNATHIESNSSNKHNKRTVNKDITNNFLIASILQNIGDKKVVQKEQDFYADDEQNIEEKNNNIVIHNHNTAKIQSEIIIKQDFASM